MTRRIEKLSSIAAGLIGAAMLLFALYGPTGTTESTEVHSDGTTVTTRDTTSLFESQDVSLVLILFVTILALSLFGVAFGAHTHAASGSGEGFTLLWVSTIALAGGTLLSMFSIGLFFVPSLLLAIVACVAGTQLSMRGRPRNRSHA